MSNTPAIYVDETHLGRHVTGLERITLELFSKEALTPLPLIPVRASGTLSIIAAQTLALPARLLANRRALAICPGFPPSIPLSRFGARVVPYVHDCFLLTRPQDLNWRAKTYMAPAFRYAVRHLPWFLVNSETTRAELARFARGDAEISLYRPRIRDVFGIAGQRGLPRTWKAGTPLRLIAIGTIEPRKNLRAAAAIVSALNERGLDARLDVVGRIGWGNEAEALQANPHVTVHGYRDAEDVRALIALAHALISTSHDEGLGLTLLEAQHGGLDVIASDLPVFREVLGVSGLLVDPAKAGEAADAIVARLARPDSFDVARAGAAANLARWNAAADGDRAALIERLQGMLRPEA